MNKRPSRRTILAGTGAIGVAAITARSAVSQVSSGSIPTELGYDSLTAFHSRLVYNARDFIVRGNVLGQESVSLGLEELVELDLLKESDVETILNIMTVVYDGPSIDDVFDRVLGKIDEVIDTLSDVGKGIVAIVRSSMETANELLRGAEYQIIVNAIAHDIRGAIDGAVAGVNLTSVIPGGKFVAALAGLFCGAVAASIIGQYQSNSA